MQKNIEAYVNMELYCPHCKTRLTCCHAPPFHIGDGLGWGSEFLHICLNDDCSLFINGWKFIEEQFGHSSSYRYMQIPGEDAGIPMMVGSHEAFTDSAVDLDALRAQDKRFAKEKEAEAALAHCVENKDLAPVLFLLQDEAAGKEARRRACELLEQLNDLTCIDPLRNHTFRDPNLEAHVNMALSKILAANHVKECPHCRELTKIQAVVCKHCGRDIG